MKRGLFVLIACAGCTTLGPMPATTGVSPVPLERPGAEVGVAIVPGYFLSSGVTENPKGGAMPQLSALLDPDRWLGVPGLVAGARLWGIKDAGTFLEPLVGYRRRVDRFSIGGLGYVSHGSQDNRDASLSVTRFGGEVMADVRATPESKWLELHFEIAAALTALWADGRYCVDAEGKYGIDCPQPPDMPGTMVATSADGLYPSGKVGAAVELGRHLASAFHGIRLGIDLAAGSMPTARFGEQKDPKGYLSLGLSLTLGLGARQ